jgi:prevent-host-death family protein
MSDTMPLAEVKNRLSEVVEDVERTHRRVTLTKHGRQAAVLIAVEDLEALEATLEILADPGALAAIREARAEVAVGAGEVLTKEEAQSRWAAPGA